MTTCAAIIPARNAALWIERCLRGLHLAGFCPGDCIVVDDGSTDETVGLARSCDATVIQNNKSKGAAAARNQGAGSTDADILLFVDADVVIAPDARKRVMTTFEDPAIDAVFGAYDTVPACKNLVSQYRNLLHHYTHRTGPSRPHSFWTGCGAVRRSAFNAIGGFDENQRMMEDVEFGMRLTRENGVIALDPELQGTHLKSWTLLSMSKTDLLDRAVPWSRLMLSDGALSNELNMGSSHRINAVLTIGLVASLVGAFAVPQLLWFALGFLAVFVALNFVFLRFLGTHAGWQVALAAVPLHLVHYCCAVAGFGWVFFTEFLPQKFMARLAKGSGAGNS